MIKLKRKHTSLGLQMFESCVTTKHKQKLQHHKLKPANVSNLSHLSFLKQNVHFKNTSECRIFIRLSHIHLYITWYRAGSVGKECLHSPLCVIHVPQKQSTRNGTVVSKVSKKNLVAWFQVSTAVLVRSSLFWDFTQQASQKSEYLKNLVGLLTYCVLYTFSGLSC